MIFVYILIVRIFFNYLRKFESIIETLENLELFKNKIQCLDMFRYVC